MSKKRKKQYRYCVSCREIHEFQLNRILNHCECKECGARFAIKDKAEIEPLIKEKYDKMIKEAGQWYHRQKALWENMK